MVLSFCDINILFMRIHIGTLNYPLLLTQFNIGEDNYEKTFYYILGISLSISFLSVLTFAPKAKSVLAENPDYHLDEITASDIVAFGDDGYTGFNLKFSTNSSHNCYAGLMEWDEDYFYLKEGDYTDNPCCFVSYRSYSTLNSISIELKDGASLPSGVSIKAFYNDTIDTQHFLFRKYG